METIFDFKPTAQELETIAFNPLTMPLRCGTRKVEYTKEFYVAHILKDWAVFDIALLHEERKDDSTAERYWSEIPGIAEEYKLGNDCVNVPNNP